MLLTIFMALLMADWHCAPQTEAEPPGRLILEFYQHGCRGFCPSYRLTFRDNGAVEYEGLRYVRVTGKSSFKLTKAEKGRLQKAIKTADLWKYPERIESRVADAPMATMTVFRASSKHSVTGSIDRPKALLDLENMVKDLAEAHGLPVRKGVSPNDPNESDRRVEVLLKPEVNAGNWITQFQELRLKLERRLGEENRWMVVYNSSEVEQSSLLQLIRDSKDVLDVKPYREKDTRN